MTNEKDAQKIINLLENNFELDTYFPQHLDLNAISNFLTKDKKNISSKIHWISIEKVGKARLETFGWTIDQLLKCLWEDYVLKFPREVHSWEEPAVIAHSGSKSICNRALIVAALWEKSVNLHNLSFGKDTNIMINALKNFGIKIESFNGNSLKISGNSVSLHFMAE